MINKQYCKTSEVGIKELEMKNILVHTKVTCNPWAKQISKIEALEIFKHWNSKKIIEHRELTEELIKIINRRLSKTSREDVMKAIDRYAEILQSDYYFSYKWTLREFTASTKGNLENFLDDGKHWVNYKDQKDLTKKVKDLSIMPICNSEEDIYSKCLHLLKTMKYEDYLQTEHWIHFKNEFLKWAGFKCQVCGETEKSIHVHHKTYENKGRETFNDVAALCEVCHALFHGKH